MALTTTPSRAAASWDTELSAAIPEAKAPLLFFGQEATPTLKLLFDNKKTEPFGPDAKWRQNFAHDSYDVHAAPGENIRYDLEDIDPVSSLEYGTKIMYVAASTNKFEVNRYKNTSRSMFDLAKLKVGLMQLGLTHVMNWLLFSKWSDTTEPIIGNSINLNTVLSSKRVLPNVYFKSITKHSDKINSIPMLSRKHVTGHTLGNVASDNNMWQPYNLDAPSATVTRDTTAWASGSHEQTDMVTAIANPEDLSYSDIEDFLMTLCVGSGHEYVAICPAKLYGVVYSYLKGMTQRSPRDEYMLDLGIGGPITDPQFDVTYYVDPQMTAMWPNSIFFIDYNHVFLVCEEGFAPDIDPWTQIPSTNVMGTMSTWSMNLATDDRANGIAAMHGWQAA